MSIYATLWQLRFPARGDDRADCEWVVVSAQGVPAHIGSPSPGAGYEKGFFRNVPVICNWLQMNVLRAEVQQNPWKRGVFSIRPQGGASWGSKLAPLLV
jgi:hypothetical protein